VKLKVMVPQPQDSRFKSWRRLVTGVDTTKTDGYAFDGTWLTAGRLVEVDEGALALFYDETGSRSNHPPLVRLVRAVVGDDAVNQDLGHGGDPRWRRVTDAEGEIVAQDLSWALRLRDRVAAVLEATLDITPPAGQPPAELTVPSNHCRVLSARRSLAAVVGWSDPRLTEAARLLDEVLADVAPAAPATQEDA
jgi:hypothetical protein